MINYLIANNAVLIFLVVLIAFNTSVLSVNQNSYITEEKAKGIFTIAADGKSTPIFTSSQDYSGVIKVIQHLQKDIYSVTNSTSEINVDSKSFQKAVIIIGTLGRNSLIDELVQSKKLNVEGLKGKRETFQIEVIKNPFPDVEAALVIVGSDKRGTIYGVFDLAEKIGVSPWYWWADVPIKKKTEVYVLPGRFSLGEPKVKYRGIFINDEAPALSGWAKAKYGTEQFNHKFYENVFELILRLKGNFLWPAMWGRAFYDDDSLNPKLADEYGVVIGTSHHEPMMRAHVEWSRYGSGPWNYEKNAEKLREFWKKGIERMGSNESIVTLAMRGDGDEAMSETANISLLQKIVNDQREIIEEVTRKDINETPQVWALYKEVQEYYDKGMSVPDDVTILLCDDNWGNLRKLPKLNKKTRKGGYGIYYHFDYVGGPRNYKWVNTNQIERVWEQMHLAYEYGAKQIWIVNVGDIKPMEFPINFFLDYAWNPELITAQDLPKYYLNWAEQQFGSDLSAEIAELIMSYTKFNARRKPELLSPETYSLINFREAERIVEEFNQLSAKSEKVYKSINNEFKDAYYQLVHHPIIACANLNELYVTTARNWLYFQQSRNVVNKLAEQVRKLFNKDIEITNYYNNVMARGKWQHMMDQTHIGYTYWQQPDSNRIPEIKILTIPNKAEMGVAVEGTEKFFPVVKDSLTLPLFDQFNRQSYFIEIFNRGSIPFNYTITKNDSWINVSEESGKIETEKRILISINWNLVPAGLVKSSFIIKGSEGSEVSLHIVVRNKPINLDKEFKVFIESDRVISIEAQNYSRLINTKETNWEIIPNLGRTSSAITSIPVTHKVQQIVNDSPRLEYEFYLFNHGELKVNLYLSPTLNFLNQEGGLQYAISIDEHTPQLVNMTNNPNPPDLNYDGIWNKWVAENINISTTLHKVEQPGKHVLKFWLIDPGVVLQKIVIDCGGLKQSYLGPPESYHYSE
ncbi:MAG: glycosyl hydrolase 115 family protein [Ignavibacteriaceae bacterium]|nr:glycosyl hydrolase 115 family protein [Ignavibacteriaceae bacterium]